MRLLLTLLAITVAAGFFGPTLHPWLDSSNALPILGALVLGAGAFVSLWGWGRAVSALAHRSPAPWPVTTVVGLGAVLFLGGVANLARVAFAPVSLAVLVAGMALAAVFLRRGMTVLPVRHLLVALPAVIAMGFLLAVQLRQSVFNPYDDLEKYFGYVARMVQTGTVFGSPLSAMGAETLGGMAWLSGPLYAYLPISYLAAVDGLFGLLLCLMLAAFGRSEAERPVAVVVAQTLIIVMPPQLVSTSPVYLGAAGLLALNLLLLRDEDGPTLRGAAVPGLLYAALVAIKPTFAIPAALHLATFAAAGGRPAARVAMGTGAWAALFTSPWILIHAPHYLAPWREALSAPVLSEPVPWLAFAPGPLGGSPGAFTAVAVGIVVAAAGVWKLGDRNHRQISVLAAATVASVGGFLVLVGGLAARGVGWEVHMRYSIPLLMAGAATVALLSPPAADTTRRLVPTAVIAALAVLLAPSLPERVRRMVDYGAWMASLDDTSYNVTLAHTRNVLSADQRSRIQQAQTAVPEGVPVIALVATPFDLDFRRNQILDVDSPGLALPWTDARRAEYVIWQYNSATSRDAFAYQEWMRRRGRREREIGARTYTFTRELRRASMTANRLYDDGQVIAFKIRR